MKTLKIFFIPLILCGYLYSFGQEYIPFPTTNAMWTMSFSGQTGAFLTCSIWMNGDTIINEQNYKKLFYFHDNKVTPTKETYLGGVREENKRIYYVGGMIDVPFCNSLQFKDTADILLYDFNIGINDTMDVINECKTYILSSVSSVYLKGKDRMRYIFNSNNFTYYDEIFEGIGSYAGLFAPLYDVQFEWTGTLTCFEENITSFEDSKCLYTDIKDVEDIKPTVDLMQGGYNNYFCLNVQEAFNGQELNYTLYNMDGKKIKEASLEVGENKVAFDELQHGIYVVGVKAGSKVVFRGKVVVW